MGMLTAEAEGVFTRERLLTIILGLITLLALYVCFQIVQPFIPPLAFALALAVATQRPYQWIRARVGGRGTVAAAIAVVCVALLIVGPIAGITAYLVQSAVSNINELRSAPGASSLQSKLESEPYIGPIVRWAEKNFRLQEQIGAVGQALAERASGLLTGSLEVIVELVITLFILFFMYRDSALGLQSMRQLLPLNEREADRVFARLGSTIQATVNGAILVAFAQATGAAIIYSILGVPLALLWAAVTFIAAFVPVFGTSLVWGPITLYLLATGHYVKGIVLLAWAGLAIGSIDNVLYPWLVGDKLRLHTVPTFFAVVGGAAVFGPAGLILGPMALAITIALLDIWWRRTAHGQAAEDAVAESPPRMPPTGVLEERNPRPSP